LNLSASVANRGFAPGSIQDFRRDLEAFEESTARFRNMELFKKRLSSQPEMPADRIPGWKSAQRSSEIPSVVDEVFFASGDAPESPK
jgi:hypothetical protein